MDGWSGCHCHGKSIKSNCDVDQCLKLVWWASPRNHKVCHQLIGSRQIYVSILFFCISRSSTWRAPCGQCLPPTGGKFLGTSGMEPPGVPVGVVMRKPKMFLARCPCFISLHLKVDHLTDWLQLVCLLHSIIIQNCNFSKHQDRTGTHAVGKFIHLFSLHMHHQLIFATCLLYTSPSPRD